MTHRFSVILIFFLCVCILHFPFILSSFLSIYLSISLSLYIYIYYLTFSIHSIRSYAYLPIYQPISPFPSPSLSLSLYVWMYRWMGVCIFNFCSFFHFFLPTYVCVSVFFSLSPIYLSIYLSFLYVFASNVFYPFHLLLHRFTDLSIYLSVSLSVFLCLCLSLSIYIYICVCVCVRVCGCVGVYGVYVCVLYFDLRPGPKMLFQGDTPEGSDTFQWQVIERDLVDGLRLMIWDKVKVPLCHYSDSPEESNLWTAWQLFPLDDD